MKVKDLVMELLKQPWDAQVVMAQDSDGSDHSPCATIKVGCYTPESKWSGEFQEHSATCEPDGVGCVKAVCLEPVN